jgi:hypothetical protein
MTTNQACPQLPEDGKAKNKILHYCLQRKSNHTNTFVLAQWYWFWTSGIQNYKKIDLCSLKPQICDNLFQQPWETNAATLSNLPSKQDSQSHLPFSLSLTPETSTTLASASMSQLLSQPCISQWVLLPTIFQFIHLDASKRISVLTEIPNEHLPHSDLSRCLLMVPLSI